MRVVSSAMMLIDWLTSLAFRAANNLGRWNCLTQLMIGIAPPSLQYFKMKCLILPILCRAGMTDKVHIFKKIKEKIILYLFRLQLSCDCLLFQLRRLFERLFYQMGFWEIMDDSLYWQDSAILATGLDITKKK